MVDRLFFGIHRVAVGPLSEGVWGRLDELERRLAFDPGRARQILDGAGWMAGSDGIRAKPGDRLGVTMATYLSPWNELATVVQSQLRDIGIEVQTQTMARGAYLDAVRAGQINLAQSAGTNFDPDELRVRYHSANKPANFAFVEDNDLDALLVKGSEQAVGSAERRQTYEAAQRRLMDLLPFVSVMTQVRVEGMAAKVHDLRMGPHGLNALPMTDTWVDG
jgi:peptide/nickel transport system substrate-binding protein